MTPAGVCDLHLKKLVMEHRRDDGLPEARDASQQQHCKGLLHVGDARHGQHSGMTMIKGGTWAMGLVMRSHCSGQSILC